MPQAQDKTKDRRTPGAPATQAAASRPPTPGKQTLTQALGAGPQTVVPGKASAPAAISSDPDAPVPGVDLPGFIDRDGGAELRAQPLAAPGPDDTHLPPGTRLFVSGRHPHAPGWWYATAFAGKAVVRGYIQRLEIATDLPEPGAELHQVVAGDTVERLARTKFGGAARDGHDLRYYENVLLHVNRGRPGTAIIGTYQDPGVLGGGANNLQLIAGKRLWLVSPEYARAVEHEVPSGSLTSGAVAKVKRFAGHVEDILASIRESRHHLGEIAGEYAQLIRDYMVAITGTLAAFAMAEAASALLAATPAGVTQVLAGMIQLVLALLGAKSVVEVSLPALSHGNAWLMLAWNARGDRAQITLASQELLRMLVQVALAVLAYRGMKQSLGNAARIAGSMPPGAAPAMASATSGAAASAGSRAASKLGNGLGPLGGGGAMMSRHDAEHGVEQAQAEPAREARSAKPEAEPKRPNAGRHMPEYPIAKSTLDEKIEETPNAIFYELEGRGTNGKTVQFGSVTLDLVDGAPKAPPWMSLDASMFIAGVEHVPRIYDDVVAGIDGAPLGQGAKTSITRLALDRFGRFYQRRFGTPLKRWSGTLAFENKR
ncbi:MAG TPA: hypothetical protein VGC42_17465, partial [Kofleriaceae bacterium]